MRAGEFLALMLCLGVLAVCISVLAARFASIESRLSALEAAQERPAAPGPVAPGVKGGAR